MRTSLFIPPVVIISGFALVITIIWNQEFKHYLPSGDYDDLALNSKLQFDFLEEGKPSYLHFFSESCKSSRVNIAHIQQVISKHQQEANFYIINKSQLDAKSIRAKYEIPANVQIIDDEIGKISTSLHIQTLPYALITTPENNLVFGGNYNNKNGLCGAADIIWSSPAVALKFVIEQKAPPFFPQHQLAFVGCSIN